MLQADGDGIGANMGKGGTRVAAPRPEFIKADESNFRLSYANGR